MRFPSLILPILLFSSFSIFSSCISSKKMKEQNLDPVDQFDENELIGVYSNKDSSILTLWEILYRSYSFKPYPRSEMAKDYLVGITKLNNEKLTASLIHNGKILDEIVLTGEIEDDYFSVKRKYFLIPIPALLIHKETKNLLCNSPNGD